MINWERLLRQRGVEFIDQGSHVKSGNININCPFCANDTKQFMGIDPATGYWGCWWSKDHRGKSPLRLLMKLLKVSYDEARELAGYGESYVDPEGFSAMAAKLMGRIQAPVDITSLASVGRLQFYPEFREIEREGRGFRYWAYLNDRRFDDPDELIDNFQLKWACGGDFNTRLIIPFIVGGEVVAWTGRAIGPAKLRYKDLEKEKCVMSPKSILYNNDVLQEGGEVLVIQEGQFDVMKIDFYGKDFDVRSVGLSTKSLTDSQLYALGDARSNFDRYVLILDTAEATDVVETMSLASSMDSIGSVEVMRVPYGYKDCGELPPMRVTKFCQQLTGKRK